MIPPVTYESKGAGGDAIVFLHGIGGDAKSFARQLDAFSVGRRAVAWNMPGYGSSPGIPQYGFPALADALTELLDRLKIGRADLFGHSIGGMVALELAATRPERVRSLILCATTPAFGSRDGSFQEQFLKARLGPLDAGRSMAEVAREAVASMTGEDPDADGVRAATETMSNVPPDAFRAAIRCLVTFDRRDALPEISVPTLLLAGERDTNAPARTMAKTAEKMPNARYVEFKGAGHLLPYERPEEVNRIVSDFLDEVERKAV